MSWFDLSSCSVALFVNADWPPQDKLNPMSFCYIYMPVLPCHTCKHTNTLTFVLVIRWFILHMNLHLSLH